MFRRRQEQARGVSLVIYDEEFLQTIPCPLAVVSIIPKGFKLIAVGERCATPTDSIDREILTLKGSHHQFDPFRVRRRFC